MDDIEPEPASTDPIVVINMAPQSQQPSLPPLLRLPYELILEIAGHLRCSTPGQDSEDFNSLSQTCRRLRQIFFPIANRHLWYDEETQFPDTLLNIVIYSFTDPLVEHVKSATIRLRKEDGSFWLGGEYDEVIETRISQLKKYITKKAEEDEHGVFKFFESQIDEYGMSTLPTVLLFLLKELKEIELAPSIHAPSSRFMLTTLHYFQPPFHLDRLGMVRLTDFAPVNYWLLERFLRLGPISTLGIDYRFGSTSGRPKIRPVPEFPPDPEEKWDPDLEPESDDDISIWSLDPEDEALSGCSQPPSGNRYGNAWRQTVEEEIEEHYKGYQSTGWQECWYPTEISYGLPGADPAPDTAFEIQDLRLWMDETPSIYEKLVPLLHKITGLRRFDLNLFAMLGEPSLGPIDSRETLDFQCIAKLLEKQTDTLESLSIRIAPFAPPQSRTPSLSKFNRLRKVHLFYTSEIIHYFERPKLTNKEPYFKFMFPQGLEFLRIDFCYSVMFVEHVINLRTEDFPNMRVVLGMFKDENVSVVMSKGLQKLWESMPYHRNPNSGLWEEADPSGSLVEITPDTGSDLSIYNIWRRKSPYHVPVQFLIILGTQKNVWCSHEGWYGPFQQHSSSDIPWNVEAFAALEPWTNDSDLDENDYSRLDPHAGPWIGTP
ncbi:uncharacterized protein DFL_009371 [Arthrobotrys flagrans]|uniref:F-box domain-containing protein n=1 Tax=Arthrobotrys flagrans TaxID=97331 RepID=A0A436ZRF0_ARTFL|nr:hypothetical protein DFL_009371 [Arthrobotrys flagrans]